MIKFSFENKHDMTSTSMIIEHFRRFGRGASLVCSLKNKKHSVAATDCHDAVVRYVDSAGNKRGGSYEEKTTKTIESGCLLLPAILSKVKRVKELKLPQETREWRELMAQWEKKKSPDSKNQSYKKRPASLVGSDCRPMKVARIALSIARSSKISKTAASQKVMAPVSARPGPLEVCAGCEKKKGIATRLTKKMDWMSKGAKPEDGRGYCVCHNCYYQYQKQVR